MTTNNSDSRTKYACSYNIGLPKSFSVEYDEGGRKLYGVEQGVALNDCLACISGDCKLKVYFNASSGEFCGFEYERDLSNIPQDNLVVPCSTDGTLKFDVIKGFKGLSVNYVVIKQTGVVYDKTKNCLQISTANGDGYFYKVCKNLLIAVDECGKLCAFFVLLENNG